MDVDGGCSGNRRNDITPSRGIPSDSGESFQTHQLSGLRGCGGVQEKRTGLPLIGDSSPLDRPDGPTTAAGRDQSLRHAGMICEGAVQLDHNHASQPVEGGMIRYLRQMKRHDAQPRLHITDLTVCHRPVMKERTFPTVLRDVESSDVVQMLLRVISPDDYKVQVEDQNEDELSCGRREGKNDGGKEGQLNEGNLKQKVKSELDEDIVNHLCDDHWIEDVEDVESNNASCGWILDRMTSAKGDENISFEGDGHHGRQASKEESAGVWDEVSGVAEPLGEGQPETKEKDGQRMSYSSPTLDVVKAESDDYEEAEIVEERHEEKPGEGEEETGGNRSQSKKRAVKEEDAPMMEKGGKSSCELGVLTDDMSNHLQRAHDMTCDMSNHLQRAHDMTCDMSNHVQRALDMTDAADGRKYISRAWAKIPIQRKTTTHPRRMGKDCPLCPGKNYTNIQLHLQKMHKLSKDEIDQILIPGRRGTSSCISHSGNLCTSPTPATSKRSKRTHDVKDVTETKPKLEVTDAKVSIKSKKKGKRYLISRSCELCGELTSDMSKHLQRAHRLKDAAERKKYLLAARAKVPIQRQTTSEPRTLGKDCPLCAGKNYASLRTHLRKMHNPTGDEMKKLLKTGRRGRPPRKLHENLTTCMSDCLQSAHLKDSNQTKPKLATTDAKIANKRKNKGKSYRISRSCEVCGELTSCMSMHLQRAHCLKDAAERRKYILAARAKVPIQRQTTSEPRTLGTDCPLCAGKNYASLRTHLQQMHNSTGDEMKELLKPGRRAKKYRIARSCELCGKVTPALSSHLQRVHRMDDAAERRKLVLAARAKVPIQRKTTTQPRKCGNDCPLCPVKNYSRIRIHLQLIHKLDKDEIIKLLKQRKKERASGDRRTRKLCDKETSDTSNQLQRAPDTEDITGTKPDPLAAQTDIYLKQDHSGMECHLHTAVGGTVSCRH